MCEQTEINYLDGDIVWVKLGACWWPGQVTGFHNLPEDIQIEFKKKSLIAAVKFFQEDTYEFVKNLHQIYKYNCTQKDDFIRKGLDKCRTKSKDGSSYMDKFPGDVEMAEKLTGGDPDILTSEKFGREEKPDISALFGEKKIPKRKRERDEMQRRSEGSSVGRKITHPRFLRESDHEIRIRQQPSSLPSTPKTPGTDSPQFSCHLCNFTSTRVNVIICHRKSHCSGGLESPLSRPRITSHAQTKSSNRPSTADTQKRKYVRKTKSLSSKGKDSESSEPVKRKLTKQIDKSTTKKKKTDPELREKLLADWDDETDDDMDLDLTKSADTSSIGSPPGKITAREIDSSINENKDDDVIDDNAEMIKASEKLLRETENFSALLGRDSSSRASRQSNNKQIVDYESETDTSILTKEEKSPVNKKPKKLIVSSEQRQSASSEKDDKQSRFSCFDFDEEDLPEPTITPVRKIPRIFGEKNTSVKKEILKKFTMSQALKNEKDDRVIDEKAKNKQDFNEKKVPKAKEKHENEEIVDKRSNVDFLIGKQRDNDDKTKGETGSTDKVREKKSSKSNTDVTELEIVEIFEVEGEKDINDEIAEMSKKSDKYEIQSVVLHETKIETHDSMDIEQAVVKKDITGKKKEKITHRRRGKRSQAKKDYDESISEIATTETEDETISELADSLQGHSENSDTDGTLNQAIWGVPSTATKIEHSRDDRGIREKPPPRRRGRPRKNVISVDPSGNGSDSPKHEMISKQVAALVTRDTERKTSESDSERSYGGRQRKPNKRYLHTNIYTSSPENRGSRTDESQSETEEKGSKQSEVRTRRGKKKSESIEESHGDTMEKNKDQEFEFSNRTLDSTDHVQKLETTNVMTKMDKEFGQIESLVPEEKLDSLETEGESSTSCALDFMKKLDSGIGSPVNITKLLSSGDSESGSLKQSQDQEARAEMSDQAKDQDDSEIRENIDEMEMSSEETKSSSKFDTLRTNVDKLPPKKSQIKKFELSQIDLLDACAEQVAAEQLAAEKLIAEKIAAEKLVMEKLAAEELAVEQAASERAMAEKLAAEKLAAEKLAAEKLVAERLAAEKLAAEILAAEKLAEERLAADKLTAERLAAEKLAEEQLAAEKLAEEELAAEKLAAERVAAEKLAAEIILAEKLAAEKLTMEKIAAEKLAAEKLAAEQLEAEKLAAERLDAERLAAEKLAAEKLAAEKLAAEKLAAEREAEIKLAAEKEAEERLVVEKIAAEKLETEKMVAEKLAAEQIAAERQLNEEIAMSQSTQSVVTETEVSTEPVEKVIVEAVPVISEKEDSTSLMVVTENVKEVPIKDSTMETIEAVLARITNEETIDETEINKQTSITSESRSTDGTLAETCKLETSKMENLSTSGATEISQRTTGQTRYKGKYTPETGTKPKKEQEITDEEIPVNSFQEAFLKTLQIDPEDGEAATVNASAQKIKENAPPQNVQTSEPTIMISIGGTSESFVTPGHIEENQNLPLNAMTEFEGVEILVQDNIVEVDTKMNEGNTSTSQMDLAAALVGSDLKNDESTLSLDLQKIQDTLSDNVSLPSPNSDISVPVKKREKPRIIENVALKEPMQILKSKLLEKIPTKSTKHKLDSDTTRKGDSKGSGPRAKMMKIDSSNSKSRSPTKSGGSHITITRKLQVLKAEEAADAAVVEKEKVATQLATQTISVPTSGEKFIQQSSQSLADMELDINSMPFVLSEDVLTPESIEQMPVVISSILPSSSSSSSSSSSTSVPTSLTLTPSTQLMTSNQAVQYKSASEQTETTSSGKKKSGTPAILKNKGKGKPTITSIKTLVPPLTGGVKGLKFQSQQATGKAMPLMTQKSSATPGKYVIVQTAGGQQMRYSVQGKPGQQKIAIPAGKAAGSAQIVQQGGKVVILTSAQSGQTKMLPLNISKSMSGKVQKIVNNKGQVYTQIGPQSITGSKTMIAPKTETSSPTTSKLAQGQKLINPQGIITSKGVLTPISTSKSGLLGLSQSILTKGGIYTPISSAQLAGKTIIGSKSLVSKSATILSPLSTQTLGSKTILSPMSHSISGKTIISAQGLITPKGTVLTPITGQQVKAIAAKSPAKGATTVSGKIPYHALQQKLQMHSQKIPVSSSCVQMRAGGSVKSPGSGSTIVFQNTMTTGHQKSTGTLGGKKIVRQIVQHGVRSPQTTIAQTTNVSSPQILQRGKSLTTTPTVQRIAGSPRSGGRQTKTQQKIVVQKLHQEMPAGGAGSSPIISMQSKQLPATPSMKTSSHKQTSRAGKSRGAVQKHLLNIASMSSGTTVASETLTSSPMPVPTLLATPTQQPIIQTPLVMPPLVIPGTELPISEVEENTAIKMEKSSVDTHGQTDNFATETGKIVEQTNESATIETPKIATPPQIMALPTESSDGTQTYVLVTIDEQGQIQPLDNNTLMSLEGTTQNADGTRTLYIDPSSLGEAGTLDNIVLQFDNGALPNIQSNVVESGQTIVSTESGYGSSEIIQTSNQDILAAALANTDFQQEIGLPENPVSSVMTTGMTQTSLINQTILQSTIIPPTEPISSPSVLETSLTLNQPIMTPLEVPSSLPIQAEPPPASVISTIPTSLELPITITDPHIAYIPGTTTANVDDAGHVQMPGNSMPDIGEIMESPASGEISHTESPTTRYLVIPNLNENMTIQAQPVKSENDSPSVTYSVSIPENVVLDNSGIQTTPSMPIIDDCYVETSEQNFTEVSVSEMLVSKANTITTEVISTVEPEASHETEVTMETQKSLVNTEKNVPALSEDSYVSQEIIVTEQMMVEQQESVPTTEESIVKEEAIVTAQEISNEQLSTVQSSEKKEIEHSTTESMQIDEQSTEIVTCPPVMEETCVSSEMNVEESPKNAVIESTNSCERQDNFQTETPSNLSRLDSPSETNVTSHEASGSFVQHEERASSPTLDSSQNSASTQVPLESTSNLECESMAVEMEVYPENQEIPVAGQSTESSSIVETVETAASENTEMLTDSVVTETSQEEAPSQSYEQFDESGVTSDCPEIPTQSAGKSENSREPSQSVGYESMEIDENTISGEPPTQSFEDTKINEASQSYEHSVEINTNAPTQSYNEIMQCQDEGTSTVDTMDDQSFPTQSYEVGKIDNISENLESDAAAIGQEGNIPSQSNDIGNDGIGTTSVSVNNSGLNEDETASSSYVPETPENQERDQDQESAISTSSYEIPPCEELNIASSSVIPDTSVRAEHMSIHDNGVPEIPTSSYNLNPDSSSTSHVDALPTSSYEDQVIVEQNVSTSYEVPISMPGLEETSSQNFVTESTDHHRNEPTSYYARHPEVTASYYEPVNQDSNSRLEADPQEEVTPSYYEQTQQDIGSEASQSYFRSTPRYTSQNVTPSYYNPLPETEASQSYYSHDIESNEQSTSSSRNVEASQSFYQETNDDMRLRPQGEATPTYTERYPADYPLENSPIERHDLVESSVPATRPTER